MTAFGSGRETVMGRKYFGTDGVRGRVGQSPITPDFVLPEAPTPDHRPYELWEVKGRGKAFVDAVVGRVGMDRFNAVWSGPQTLPLPAEIEEPQRWIDRVL